MKYINIFILIVIFAFTGCSQKEIIINDNQPKQVIVEKKPKKIEYKKQEVISVFDGINIDETLDYKESNKEFTLAILYPSSYVSNYYKSAINTVLGYFSYRNIKFDIKAYDCVDESFSQINKCFNEAYKNGYKNVIGLFTPNAFDKLESINIYDMKVYLPLIEKKQTYSNYIFGSISYEEQIKKLLEFAYMNTSVIYQDNFLGNKLYTIHNNINSSIDYSKKINNSNNYYKNFLENKEILNYSSLFLYTNNIKASLVLSQMTVYEKAPSIILSTQQNYKPDIFRLTQSRDRKNFLVANSISRVNHKLKDTMEQFGSDITYNWVDYSVLIGINYLLDENNSGLLKEKIIDNQVVYQPKIYEVNSYGFLEIK